MHDGAAYPQLIEIGGEDYTWHPTRQQAGEEILGEPGDFSLVLGGDIQSLADLGNSFEVVRTMRIAPVTTEALLRLVAATLVPLVPLALTMMSLEELLKRLIGIVF